MRPEPMSPWHGLLRADERDRALRVVDDIAQRLRSLRPDALNPSLCDGSAGIALALAYVSLATGDDGSTADDFLGSAYDALSADPAAAGISLAAGACGVGWVGAHFDRLAGVKPTSGDMDNLVLPLLAEWAGPWELLYGLVGVGVYTLEAGGGCLDTVLARLCEVAADDWVTDTLTLFGPASQRPPRYVDLGLAHGVPGVLALTSAAARSGDDLARALAASAAQSLLAHEFPLTSSDSRYPATIEPGVQPAPTQVAWCYGDAGAALALAAATDVLADPTIGQAASRAAAAAAARPHETSGVIGLGLCHGTAGVAHTMGRLAGFDESVAPAAREWALRLLRESEFGQLPDTPGVLSGQAGVALALLAAATDMDPGWDRALLLSSV
ncbi:lanthionine synthetase LanC family protein [Antrihabitans spumae]|uniref:Lanthionine synthetase LanC family protein n=1 Tax=Antrihabitans spumae TaxID=3373370 RepID=A0ABW7K6U8_9NOCA